MRRLSRILLNAATAMSLMLCVATSLLGWVTRRSIREFSGRSAGAG